MTAFAITIGAAGCLAAGAVQAEPTRLDPAQLDGVTAGLVIGEIAAIVGAEQLHHRHGQYPASAMMVSMRERFMDLLVRDRGTRSPWRRSK